VVEGDKSKQGPQWSDAEALYWRIYKRDNPGAAEWQIAEAIDWERLHFERRLPNEREKLVQELRDSLQPSDGKGFGQWLSDALKQQRWSQSELARTMKAHPSLISKWVNGVQRPRTAQCALIAEALEIHFEEVLQAAGHLPSGGDHSVLDWIVESEIRDRILQLVGDIPEPLLMPLVPMLEGLVAEAKKPNIVDQYRVAFDELADKSKIYDKRLKELFSHYEQNE
jgi:transcriptional regulator with XRE-family HTH domain